MTRKNKFLHIISVVLLLCFLDILPNSHSDTAYPKSKNKQRLKRVQREREEKKEAKKNKHKKDIAQKKQSNRPRPQKQTLSLEELTEQEKRLATMQKIDGIKVIIYTDGDAIIITESDLRRPSLDGTPQTLQDLIFQYLVYHESKKFNMLPDEDTVDKYLKSIQRDNNLTLDQLKEIFKASGYTYDEGRTQIALMSTVSAMIDFKIGSRLIVPESSIRQYYEEHKQTVPAQYQIARMLVPFSTKVSGNKPLQDVLAQFAKTETGFSDVVWSAPFWVASPDIAEDKQFIRDLLPGQISEPLVTDEGFELFKLISCKPESVVSLDDSAREIAALLRKPLFEAQLAEYREELLKSASIVYY